MNYKLISIRECIGEVLCEFAKKNSEIFVIDSDLAKSTTTNTFQDHFPDRFIETGISEQNAMSIAMGLAYEKKIPFYVNFAIFLSGTCWTQLRQICYSNANVKLIATHPGMDNGYDGATHHANEDLALMRSLPNMKVLIPSNREEFEHCIELALETDGPVYIRTARDMVPDLPAPYQNMIGKSVVQEDAGNDFALVYEGSSADLAMRAFEHMKTLGKNGKLVNIFSLKPIDEELISEISKTCKLIVSLENHSIIGGLGSSIADVLAQYETHAPLVRVGVEDVFTESGSAKDVKEKYGLNLENIVSKIIK